MVVYNSRVEQAVKLSYFRGKPPHELSKGRQSVITASCSLEQMNEYPFDSYDCLVHIVNLDGNYRDKVELNTQHHGNQETYVSDHEFDYKFDMPVSQNLYNYRAIRVGCRFSRNRHGRKKVFTFYATTTIVSALSLISYFVDKVGFFKHSKVLAI